jgi:hypothetical protein
MKRLIFILVLFWSSAWASAQVKIEFGPQINSAWSKDFSLGVGAAVDVKYMIASNISIGVTAGFHHYFMANGWENSWYNQWGYTYKDASTNLTPIRASINYYFGSQLFKPYGGIEAGVNIQHSSYSYYDSSYGWIKNDNKETHFALAPNAGIELGLGDHFSLDFNAKYNGFDQSYFSFKFGIIIIVGSNK